MALIAPNITHLGSIDCFWYLTDQVAFKPVIIQMPDVNYFMHDCQTQWSSWTVGHEWCNFKCRDTTKILLKYSVTCSWIVCSFQGFRTSRAKLYPNQMDSHNVRTQHYYRFMHLLMQSLLCYVGLDFGTIILLQVLKR